MARVAGDMSMWLPVVWALVISSAVALYVVLDGFDLGIGILFPLYPSETDRDLMMNSVAPFWDGNETWLVLGGGGLFVAFPLAYAIVMPAIYLPLTIMLLALVFRGVSFEFRWVAKPRHQMWDLAFSGGSIVASFTQGLILGTLIQGIEVKNLSFAGDGLNWLSTFSVFVGFSMVAGYGLLGAAWLNMKVEGPVADRARKLALKLLVVVLLAMAAISLWTPLLFESVFERWFSLPNIFYLLPVPFVTVIAAIVCWRGLTNAHEYTPFLAAIALFLLGFAGLGISLLPYIVPPTVTIWQAAAAPESQLFMLVGTAILLPVVLGYTVFVYWTFRGKIRPGEGYH